VAEKLEETISNLKKLPKRYEMKEVILKLIAGGLLIPRAPKSGERGRPPLTLEEKKDRVNEGKELKREVNSKTTKRRG